MDNDNNNYQLVLTTDWQAARDKLLLEAKAITTVASDADLERATAIDTTAKKLLNSLETYRKGITSRLDAVKKNIMAQQRELAAALETEQNRVNRLCVAYATEQERKRQEELRRIEEERRREAEAAAAAAAAAEAAASDPASPDYDPFGMAAPEPVVMQPIERVPIQQRPRSKSAAFVKVYKFEIQNEADVPRQFLCVDESRIRKFVEYQKSQGVEAEDIRIPGIRVYSEMSVRAR